MNILKKIKDHIVINLKIISLWDVREHFTFSHYLKIVFLLFLNLVHSPLIMLILYFKPPPSSTIP